MRTFKEWRLREIADESNSDIVRCDLRNCSSQELRLWKTIYDAGVSEGCRDDGEENISETTEVKCPDCGSSNLDHKISEFIKRGNFMCLDWGTVQITEENTQNVSSFEKTINLLLPIFAEYSEYDDEYFNNNPSTVGIDYRLREVAELNVAYVKWKSNKK